MRNILKIKTTMNTITWAVGESDYIDAIIPMVEKITDGMQRWEAGRVPFEELPETTQEEVKSVLKAFNECNVKIDWINNDWCFDVHTCSVIKAEYSPSEATCGWYKAEDIYTAEERRENFFESFGYYPHYTMKSNKESLN